jgi:hypothetical protein
MAKLKNLIGIEDLKKVFSSNNQIILDENFITDGYIVINQKYFDLNCVKLLKSIEEGKTFQKFEIHHHVNIKVVFPQIEYIKVTYQKTAFSIRCTVKSGDSFDYKIYTGINPENGTVILTGVNNSFLEKLSAFTFFDDSFFGGCNSKMYNRTILVHIDENNDFMYGVMPVNLEPSDAKFQEFKAMLNNLTIQNELITA